MRRSYKVVKTALARGWFSSWRIMIPILLACVIWMPALMGLGMPLSRLLRRAGVSVSTTIAIRAAICGLTGMFVASAVAAIANLFVPLYPLISTTLLALGWFLAIRYRSTWHRLPPGAWRLFIVVFLVIVFIDARGLAWYDTGLYHLQAVRWVSLGPLPRGLANLDGRLGFNSAWFTLAGTLETPLLLGKSCFVLNAILAILVALPAIDSLLRMRGRAIKPDQVVLALMLVPLALFGVGVGMISSLSPDLVVIVLTLFMLALWVRSVGFAPHVFCFACFAVLVKLSAAPMLPLAAMALLWSLRRGVLDRREVMFLGGFIVAAAIVFIFRGIWLSGYPAFPTLVGRMSWLRWTVPIDIAVNQANAVEYWAKYHQSWRLVSAGTPWISVWFAKSFATPGLPIAVSVFVAGATIGFVRRPRSSPFATRAFFAMLALMPAVGFWFVEAPQLRLGYGYVLGVAALPLAIGLAGAVPRFSARGWNFSMMIVIVTLLLVSRIDRQIFKPRLLTWPEIPIANLAPRQIESGALIWTPVGTDQVWNTPQLATPELDQRLRWEMQPDGRISEFWIKAGK